MRQKLTLLTKTMLLLCALVAGSGSAWAEKESVSCATSSPFFSGTYFTYTAGKTSGNDPAYNPTDGGLRLYVNNYLTITPNNGETITAVTLTVKCNQGGSGSNKAYPESVTVNSGSITSGGTPGDNVTSIVWSGGTSGTSNDLTFTVNGAKGNVAVKSIEITYTPVNDNRTATTVTIDDSGITNIYLSEGTTAGSLSATVKANNAAIDGATVTWSTEDTDIATVNSTTGAVTLKKVGTATIKASYEGNTSYKPSFAEYELTVVKKKPHVAAVGEVFYESFDTNEGTGGNDGSWSGSIASNTISSDNTGWSFTKGSGADACAKFGASSSLGKAITPSLNLSAGIYTLKFKAGAWNATNESTTLKLSATNAELKDPEDKTVSSVTMSKGAFTNYTVTVKVADTKAVTITFEGNSGSNSRFFLDEVQLVMNSATVNVGAKGFATFVSGQALDFTGKSIQAYTISSTNGSALTLTPKANVAKNEPVLLYSETNSDKQSIPVIATADVDATNKLVQGTGASITWSESAKYYVLYTGGEAPGFFRANASPIAKDKAYLDLTGVGATARSFTLIFDGEAQGIDDVNIEITNDNRYYDLQGRRVAQPTKGMYIVNGKKVIMK